MQLGRIYTGYSSLPIVLRLLKSRFSVLYIFIISLLCAWQFTPSTEAANNALMRVLSVRLSETAEGSRVTILSDSRLDGYSSRATSDGRFELLIPQASAPNVPSGLSGLGFTDMRVEQHGSQVLLSFRPTEGTAPRIIQSFNRIYLIFAQGPQGSTSTPQPDPANSPAPETPATSQPPASPSETPQARRANNARTNAALPPAKAQPMHLPRFEHPPVIDGRLDDEVWQHAIVLTDFIQIQPGDNIAPSKQTEVLLGYDSRFLYIAFRAFDEPGKVRSSVAKRDQVFDDDHVGLFLDTFNDQRKAYELFFNPLGVQADAIRTEGENEDFSVDIVMESKGVLTDNGYTVEVAIPFKSLRYEAGRGKLWGVHFLRRIQRFNGELDSWMPISRDISSALAQEGHIADLENLSTERTIELIPSLAISESARRVPSFPSTIQNAPAGFVDSGRLVNEPIHFDPGLTARFGLTPTVSLDLALNPDFAQVEADQLVVRANQRFPIFFEEKRPFFLEGIDIFQTPLTAVHTRAIVDPDWAVKLTGKRGRNSFGFLLASDNAPGNFSEDERGALRQCQELRLIDPRVTCPDERFIDHNAAIGVLRLKRDVGRESSLGLIATSYSFIDNHNQVGGIDGRFRINKISTLSFQLLGTTSRRFFFDPDRNDQFYRTGNGFGYEAQYNVDGRNWGGFLEGTGFTRDYRANVGFTRRTNTNHEILFVRYNSNPKPKAKLVSWRVTEIIDTNFDWQGRQQYWGNENQLQLNFQRQSFIGIGASENHERIFEEEFGARRGPNQLGTFFGAPDRTTQRNNIYLFTGSTPSRKYSFFLFTIYNWGAMDFDFGAGPKFPRVSPSAIRAREAAAAGLCDVDNPPAVCLGLQDPGRGDAWDLNLNFSYQPIAALHASLDYTKSRLVRRDTGLTAFDENIFSLRTTYQFTRFTFARARVDYDTLGANMRGQFLLGWTPNPGTSFYVGYNDDMNFNGFSPINGNLEPGFRRNARTFFIKMSYLFRKSIGN